MSWENRGEVWDEAAQGHQSKKRQKVAEERRYGHLTWESLVTCSGWKKREESF